MTADADEGDGYDAADAAQAWEAAGARMAWWRAFDVRDDVDDALFHITEAFRDGEVPTAAEVEAARKHLDEARDFIETVCAELADGAEPWDAGAGRLTPYGVLREQLEDAVSTHAPTQPGSYRS